MDNALQPLTGLPAAFNPGAAPAATAAAPTLALDRLPLQRSAQVWRVDPVAAGQPADRAQQLADIGFMPGEWVMVLGQAWPGGDPLVVRVGQSRFALRRAEAACVLLQDPS